MANADAHFSDLFQLINQPGKRALAVSGGADSTALMVLAARHARKTGRQNDLCVLSVDHQLRPSSQSDGEQVCAWAQALGLRARLLTWRHEGVATRVQEAARAARYRLMARWCAENGFDGIITAHHLDDQAETMLMRLARGSGVDGVSGMTDEAEIFGAKIHRPFLQVPRAVLREQLRNSGHDWIEDPANENSKFERVRVREALAALADAGVEPQALALSARRLQRARAALEEATARSIATSVETFETGHCEIDLAGFEGLSGEIRLRVLARVITWAGGLTGRGETGVNMAKLERVVKALAREETPVQTLSGTRIVLRKSKLVIGREFGRIDQNLQKGVTHWDNRFVFDRPRDVQPYGVFIDDDTRPRPDDLPHFIACSLPAFVSPSGAVTVPHLDGGEGVSLMQGVG